MRERERGQTEQESYMQLENYFKSTIFGYVIIVAESKARGFMHILNGIKGVVSK